MSFFLTSHPSSVTTSFDKPRGDERSQSGVPTTRRYGVAFWRGVMNFMPQRPDSIVLGELERADALDGFFYADLYPRAGVPKIAAWLAAATMSTTGFTTTAAGAASYSEGDVVSIRSALGLTMVTARVITERRETTPGIYAFFFETPLPQEFVSSRAGVTYQVCFNRPHVRARIKSDSVQWTTRYTREMRPLAVSWFEDSATMINSLFAAARSPSPPGEIPVQNRFLVTEDETAYLATEDGRFLVTER